MTRIMTLTTSPFEFLLSVGCVMYGLIVLTNPSAAGGAVGETLSPVINVAWGVALTIGGSLVVAGMVIWPQARVRLAGVGLLASAILLYGLILIGTYGIRDTLAPIMIALIGVAFAARAYSLRKILTGRASVIPHDDGA